MAITKKQQELIRKCQRAGYGWARFADSVEASGRCSIKQEETMVNMLSQISYLQKNRIGRRVNRGYGPVCGDFSEHEATMSEYA